MADNDKKAALLERKAARDAAAKAALDALDVQALELEEKYIADGKTLGVDFAIETFLVGNFAVRNPDFLIAKKFSDAETRSVEEVIQFVAPCVIFPEQMLARTLIQEHAGIAWRLSALMMQLHGAEAGARRGK